MGLEEHFEVLVVGAGLASLSAAKAYIQCAPQTDLLILDDHKSIGGVWCKENIYEGLRSNNLRGTLEFPDFPFHDGYGVKYGEHVPGMVVHQYLCDYAKHFGIDQRIRFSTRVIEVEKLHDGWRLLIEKEGEKSTIKTNKLIVGTGQASKPVALHLLGEEDYDAPMLGNLSLVSEAPALFKDPEIQNVTVFGGSKHAYDCVYKFACAGKKIDWVIRESGHGPAWMFVPYQNIGPLGRMRIEDLATKRFISWLSPCYWGDLDGSGWWRWLLHETWLGRFVIRSFWAQVGADMLEQSGYNNHPALKALHPDCAMFEQATSSAVLNYPTDILDFVRSGQVKVHRQDVTHLSYRAVHLKSGTILPSDAFIASTSWRFGPTIDFKDTAMHSDLGIPSFHLSSDQKSHWSKIDARADAYILGRYPMLRDLKYPPSAEEDLKEEPLSNKTPLSKQREYSPLRLYRGIAPPALAAQGDRSLAFAGYGVNISHWIKSEIAGLWIWAFMNDKLAIDPNRHAGLAETEYQTALYQRFSMLRYPYGLGRRMPDFLFEAIPFNDVLLGDLGMKPWRKVRQPGKWPAWREWWETYGMADYRGLTEEWLKDNKLD